MNFNIVLWFWWTVHQFQLIIPSALYKETSFISRCIVIGIFVMAFIVLVLMCWSLVATLFTIAALMTGLSLQEVL